MNSGRMQPAGKGFPHVLIQARKPAPKPMEHEMANKSDRPKNKGESGTAKKNQPGHVGGDHARKAQQWGGGSKASKGSVSESDKHNPNSIAKT
ncbi:hypothetical protein ILFOPFJJ_02196 [Ensifer psoraleae]|nr:hypothetical protein [Sinorhizobium psoraleae]